MRLAAGVFSLICSASVYVVSACSNAFSASARCASTMRWLSMSDSEAARSGATVISVRAAAAIPIAPRIFGQAMDMKLVTRFQLRL